MAELESQPLSDEERAELEELRAEKARREEQARRAAEEAQRQELLLPEDPPEPEYDMERD